jgi:hypothetical protein
LAKSRAHFPFATLALGQGEYLEKLQSPVTGIKINKKTSIFCGVFEVL